MKILLMAVLAALSMSTCMAQTDRSDGQLPKQKEQNVISPLKVMHKAPDGPVYNENFDDLCQKYRNIKLTGIVMSVIGGGVMTAGIVIHLQTNHQSLTDETYAAKKYTMLHNGGDAAIALGTTAIAVGLPMIAIASIKNKRTCGGHRTDLGVQSGENGLGMAVKF